MEIESDVHDCSCGRGKGRLRLFQGWKEDPWSDYSHYSPTFLNWETYHSFSWKILISVLWFVPIEFAVSRLVFAGPEPLWVMWFLFGVFTLIAAAMTFLFAFLTVDCIDVLCHVFIGQTRYVFLDGEGRLHIHDRDPVSEYPVAYFSDFQNWESYLLSHRIFQIRSGGIFRRCKVIAYGGTMWKIEVGIFERKIHIVDEDGSRFVIVKELESWVDHTVTERERLMQALRFVVKNKRLNPALTALDLHEEVGKSFDTLGVECVELIQLMEASRQTMGRSKHAQLLRERLEAVFKKLPEQRVQLWADKVAETKSESAEAES